MPEPLKSTGEDPKPRAQAEVIDARWPFGPLFFMSQLRGFIRDRCPDSQNALPELELHLADGQALDVCHVVAISPWWIALAVYEPSPSRGTRQMRTEFVPYGMIARITLALDRGAAGQLGFDVNRAPMVTVKAQDTDRSAEQAVLSARCQTT